MARPTTHHGFTLFDTAIGRCGIAWSGRGIAAVHLPEGREPDTRARVLERFPGARESRPPAEVRRAIDAVSSHLRGEPSDLSSVVLDMERVPPFSRRVYEATRAIAPGGTLTYGDIAARLGAGGACRAVGQALRRNPFPIIVPCHRVLAAGERVGGFSAAGGIATKLRLLGIERPQAPGAQAASPDGRLGFDPRAALEHVRASDAALARLIDEVGPLRLRVDRTSSLFAALAQAIVYQQLTGKAAATIFARVRALFPRPHEGPTPEQILSASERRLRAAGLSRPKLLSLRDLARKAHDGHIPELGEVARMTDEAIVERLTEVRGIGRWTVEMLLIFRLGRPDVLPLDDYGIRKGFAAAFGERRLPTRGELEERGARWRPYRTVASWYLWRAAEAPKRGALNGATGT